MPFRLMSSMRRRQDHSPMFSQNNESAKTTGKIFTILVVSDEKAPPLTITSMNYNLQLTGV